MASRCVKCETEIRSREKYLQCNGFCEKFFHQSCAGLSDIAFKVITEKHNVFWSCDACGIGKSCSIRKIFMNFEDAFNQLSSEIRNQKSLLESDVKVTYADKLKKSEPVLVIKPKVEGQSSTATKNDLKRLVDPTEIEISGLKSVSNGGIVVECKNAQAISKLKKEAQSKLGESYNINEPKKRRPSIKIIGMREKRTTMEIEEKLKAQNKILNARESYIKVVHVAEMKAIKNRPVRYFAYAEVDVKSYNKLMEEKELRIGWDVCKVFDGTTVTRCFNCCGYNHKAAVCKKETRCPKCAGSHKIGDCKATENNVKCVNCEEAVRKLNLRITINHAAWDSECSVFKRKLEIEKSKVHFLE